MASHVKHHGIELALNSNIRNLVVESLTTDPAVTVAGRIWYNSDENVWKGSFLDESDNVVVREFATGGDLSSFLEELASTEVGEGTNLIGYQGFTGAEGQLSISAGTLKSALDAIATIADATAQSVADIEADNSLQDELDRTQAAAGIGNDGNFIAPDGTNFIDDATTVLGASVLLDTALNQEILDRGQALTNLRGDLASNDEDLGASLIGIEDAAGNFTATTVEEALAEIVTNVGSVSLQDVYDQTPNVGGNAVLKLEEGKAFVIEDDNTSTYFRVDPNGENPVNITMSGPVNVTGSMTISGELLINGTTTQIDSTVTSSDHFILQPASAVMALDVNPATSFSGEDVVNVRIAHNGSSVFRISAVNNRVETGTLLVNGAVAINGATTFAEDLVLNFGANRLTNIADGTAPTDAASVGQLNAAVSASEDIQEELDRTQAAVGVSNDGNYVPTTDTNYINGATSVMGAVTILDDELGDVQAELNATQTGAGLNQNGTYVQPEGSNYLDETSSLAGATLQLDTTIKTHYDGFDGRINAIETDTGLQDELNTTQTSVGLNTDGTYVQPTTTQYLNSTNTVMQALKELDQQVFTNAEAISQEALDRAQALTDLRTSLNNRKFTVTTSAPALVHDINHNLDSEYVNYTVLVQGNDTLFRNDIVAVTEVNNNTLRIELTESHNVKVVVTSALALT